MRFTWGKINRVVLAFVCLVVMSAPAAAVTFDFMQLTNWSSPAAWTTNPDINRYALGVSTTPGGSLIPLDANGGLKTTLETGNVYYLYAGNLGVSDFLPGRNVSVDIYTDYIVQGGGSPRLYAGFDVVGSPGTFQLWNVRKDWYWGTTGGLTPTEIYLGWAQGTADKVGGRSFSPDGINDYYLVLGIGVEPTPPSGIPEPHTLLMLGSGLVGLMGYGRKKFRR